MDYRFGLIGYPLKHSLSPWIHEKFLKQTGLTGSYGLYEIKPTETFADKMMKLRSENLNGFNITAPYKKTIMPYLDDLHEQAKAIGAVNTVVNKNGKWIGYNTDGNGYLRSLLHAFPSVEQDKAINILILGSGGAARAILYTLSFNGYRNIDIANRTKQTALELRKMYQLTNTSILSLQEAENVLQKYDLIVQTTSVGMEDAEGRRIITMDNLTAESIVSDIIYKPLTTHLLKDAKNAGANILRGHTMLLYQAQYAFELWTNIRAPLNNMEMELLKKLKG